MVEKEHNPYDHEFLGKPAAKEESGGVAKETVGRIIFNADQPIRSGVTCTKNCGASGSGSNRVPYNPLSRIVGQSSYRQFAIQPVEFITRNRLSFLQGCVIKRICRYDREGGKGVEDLRKIIHEVELIIKLQGFDGDDEMKKRKDEFSKFESSFESPSVSISPSSIDPVDKLTKAHELEIERLMDGVDEGHRNEWATRLTKHFLDEYKNDLSAVSNTMRMLNIKNRPPIGDGELRDIVWAEYQKKKSNKEK